MKRQGRWGLAALALLLALPGCGSPQAEPSEPGETSGVQQEQETAPGSVPEAPEDPTHFYEEVQENLLIDAEVTGPPEGVVPKVYEGIMKSFTKEEIDAFLAWNGDAVAEITWDGEQDQSYVYSGTCRSGSIFGMDIGLNNDFPLGFSYVNWDKNERFSSYPIYSTETMYEQGPSNYIAELFTEPEDMSFATAEEAEAEVREALETLHLGELKLNRTLYVSHTRMEQAGEVLQGEEWTRMGKGGSEVTYPQWDDWDETDDCYLFEFFSSADGIPMTHREWDGTTVSYCPNSIVVWYTGDGIVCLSVLYPWTFGKIVEEPERIVSAGDALLVAREKYANIISTQSRVIEKVELTYVYEQDGDGWVLRPVWEVVIRQKASEMIPFDTFSYVRVDAVTGEEM